MLRRALFACAALLLLGGATVHTRSFPVAAKVLGASNLSPQFAAAFKGLWLIDSVLLFGIGGAFLGVAIAPKAAARVRAGALIAILLGSALALYLTVGNFVPAHLLVAAALLALVAEWRSSPSG